MSGEQNLEKLFKSLSAKLAEGVHVFVTVSNGRNLKGVNPRMIFQETEGTTFILLKTEAESNGLAYEFPCRMITLDVHSSLEAIGFIAAIATELAMHGMGVNPVSGFFHDHLFVPDGREQEALEILKQIANRNN